jgi:hypothetical protein
MAEAFTAAFGSPDPQTEPALTFESPFDRAMWSRNAPRVGAGYFRDRFLYLFGPGLEDFRPCLEAWSFLVPKNPDRMIVGRNAYGAIAYLDHPNGDHPRVTIVDPITVSLITDTGMDLWRFIGRYLPEGILTSFLDDRIYREWLSDHHLFLDPALALTIKTPTSLGGKMTLENFSVEDLITYYQTTGEIYRAHRSR